jgi:hypothetical protein
MIDSKLSKSYQVQKYYLENIVIPEIKMEKEILFRASGAGALLTNKQGSVITEGQLKRITELLYENPWNKLRWK